MRWMVGSLLFLVVTLTIAYPAPCAESVEGVLIDHNSGNPIPYCRVYIGDNRALTDADGNFVLLLEPGIYRIRVQGYNIRRVDGSNTNELEMLKVLPRILQRIQILVSR